jgi:MFS family permease
MADKKENSVNSGFVLVIFSHALNHVYDTLLPILYPILITEFKLSYGAVGILVMGYRLSSGALQIVMGFLGRFVKRKYLLGFGMIWQAIANFFTALSPGFEVAFIGRTLAGIGASPQHPTGAAYIADSFDGNHLGKAMGLNVTAAQIGRFVTPFIASLVLLSFGWRATLIAFSIPGLVIGILFLFLGERKRSEDRINRSTLKVLVGGMREVLRNRTVLMVMIVETVMAFRAGAADFIPTYLVRAQGMTALEAGVLFTIFLGSGIPAAYFWGYLSDRFQRRWILMLVMGAASILWFLLPYGKGSVQIILILMGLGFVCQGVGGIIQAFVGEATTHENRDLVYGIYFTLSYVIGSISPVVLGYVADAFGFQMGFSYVALVSISGVIAAYFLK